MRIKEEIMDMVNKDGTVFLIRETDTDKTWYLITQTSKCSLIAHGLFTAGNGTRRKRSLNQETIISQKIELNYSVISKDEFVQLAIFNNMFSHSDVSKKEQASLVPKLTPSQMNPLISSRDRQSFMERLSNI